MADKGREECVAALVGLLRAESRRGRGAKTASRLPALPPRRHPTLFTCRSFLGLLTGKKTSFSPSQSSSPSSSTTPPSSSSWSERAVCGADCPCVDEPGDDDTRLVRSSRGSSACLLVAVTEEATRAAWSSSVAPGPFSSFSQAARSGSSSGLYVDAGVLVTAAAAGAGAAGAGGLLTLFRRLLRKLPRLGTGLSVSRAEVRPPLAEAVSASRTWALVLLGFLLMLI
mmetsp:Transcript_16312/g.38341  ORF Transcript_16312/g.38341 Transcript_16312/m.38341 type:complete len:227 (-) Transcript_16312:1928-2608(-)